MLYDPLQDGVVKTSKKMQYAAALIGKLFLTTTKKRENSIIIQNLFTVCLGAVSAGTALAWTSPVLPQISAPDPSANTTVTNSTDTNNEPQLQLTLSQRKSSSP